MYSPFVGIIILSLALILKQSLIRHFDISYVLKACKLNHDVKYDYA